MTQIAGPNGPIIFITEQIEITVTQATASRYAERLGRQVAIGERIAVAVTDLSHGSNATVVVECPMCGRRWEPPYYSVVKKGHTYCQPCRQRVGAYAPLIGRKVGRLTITGFSAPADVASGGARTTLTAHCDCGTDTTVYGQSVLRAIRKGSELSCGCVSQENARTLGLKNSGEQNGMYRHDLSLEERVARKKLLKHIKSTWGRAVRRRDRRCVVCDATTHLEAHHLYNINSHPDLCLILENGVTLCATHHQDFHCSHLGHVHHAATPGAFYAYLVHLGWSSAQVDELIADKHLLR